MSRNSPMSREISFLDEITLWKFIYEEIIKNKNYHRVDERFFEDFIEKSQVIFPAKKLNEYYLGTMRGTLYKCALPKEHVLELYKTLKIEISKHVEQMIESQFWVVLHLNSDRILENYRFFDSKSADNQESIDKSIGDDDDDDDDGEEFSIELEQRMWKFADEKYERLRPQRTKTSDFWQEFLWHTRFDTNLSATRLAHHFAGRMLKDTWDQKLRPQVKMSMLQELEIPIDERKRLKLLERERICVSVDGSNHVKNWRLIAADADDAENGKMELRTPKRENSRRSVDSQLTKNAPVSRRRRRSHLTSPYVQRARFTVEDDVEMWRFVLKEMENEAEEELMPKGLVLWSKYVQETPHCGRSPQNLASHYRKFMEPKLHLMPLSIREKVRLYARLRIPIPLAIRISARVKLGYEILVDSNNNIRRMEKVDEPEPEPDDALFEQDDAPEHEEVLLEQELRTVSHKLERKFDPTPEPMDHESGAFRDSDEILSTVTGAIGAASSGGAVGDEHVEEINDALGAAFEQQENLDAQIVKPMTSHGIRRSLCHRHEELEQNPIYLDVEPIHENQKVAEEQIREDLDETQ